MVLQTRELQTASVTAQNPQAVSYQSSIAKFAWTRRLNPSSNACSTSPRLGQAGTWIVPDMVQAYIDLHHAGFAHSIETWVDGKLEGGLYCVAVGNAVFGESMFARSTDASKIALSALVALCREHGVALIDCQQNTRHLASLGASEIPRSDFLAHIRQAQRAFGASLAILPPILGACIVCLTRSHDRPQGLAASDAAVLCHSAVRLQLFARPASPLAGGNAQPSDQ